ncbi:NUDIX hydrolase [Streptosporangium sp. NPDC048865]|uniref:NUDIX hydrolase n=1 Tax=Streptosporangium sp. NPDC048865 TaxID=3155766 RepID=UPI003416EF04
MSDHDRGRDHDPAPVDLRPAGRSHIGVSCSFVCHDGRGRVLLHMRGPGARDSREVWDSGAGELGFGEDFEECVRREVREEFGAAVLDLVQVGVANVRRTSGELPTHWVSVQFAVLVDPGEITLSEPDRVGNLTWFGEGELPAVLHPALPDLLARVAPHIGWSAVRA